MKSICTKLFLAVFVLCLSIGTLKSEAFAETEEYFVYGALSIGMKPTNPELYPNDDTKVLYYMAFGDWRNDTGAGSPEDLIYKAVSYTHLTLPTICSV